MKREEFLDPKITPEDLCKAIIDRAVVKQIVRSDGYVAMCFKDSKGATDAKQALKNILGEAQSREVDVVQARVLNFRGGSDTFHQELLVPLTLIPTLEAWLNEIKDLQVPSHIAANAEGAELQGKVAANPSLGAAPKGPTIH